MSGKLAIMAGLAVVFGTTSYYAGNSYLESQAQARLNEINSQVRNVETKAVVIATKDLRFGEPVKQEHLKLVAWPKEALPSGAFTTIEDVVGGGQRRVLRAVAANEPLLKNKLSGENGRASLSGVIADGMRAVTIPVDSVRGVGGFVQPGDFVDIVHTQMNRRTGTANAKIIMQRVKVLTVDQKAETTGGATLANTVTLETDAEGAKRIALASETGRMSLILRSVDDDELLALEENPARAVRDEPENAPSDGDDPQDGGGILSIFSSTEPEPTIRTVRVVRGEAVKEKTVPIEAAMQKNKKQEQQ